MAEHHHELCRVLNDLVSTCNDSWEGFGKAAKGVHDDELRNWLTEVSGERARFAQELSDQVTKRGGQPADAGHFGGILHRGWVDLESRIRPKDDGAIRLECAQGEQSTLNHYDEALSLPLPDDVKQILSRHHNAIAATLDQLQAARAAHR